MACPTCGCKTTYVYDDEDEDHGSAGELERCSACGAIFYDEDHILEDDDEGSA